MQQNFKNLKLTRGCFGFGFFFYHLSLFRISDFVLRILRSTRLRGEIFLTLLALCVLCALCASYVFLFILDFNPKSKI